MMLFFRADAAMMANVDFPDPRRPTRTREASELKSGILALANGFGGVGVLEMFSGSDDTLVRVQYFNRRPTVSGSSVAPVMVANGLLTPAMMPHSVNILADVFASERVQHEDKISWE